MPLSFPLPIKQVSDCGSLRTTIYRSPTEPGQLDRALRLPTRVVTWLPPYTSVRDAPVETGGALSWLSHGRQSQQIRASLGYQSQSPDKVPGLTANMYCLWTIKPLIHISGTESWPNVHETLSSIPNTAS